MFFSLKLTVRITEFFLTLHLQVFFLYRDAVFRLFRILYIVRHLNLDIDNQTLVEECRNGDRDAMSILYTRLAPRMLHVITRYVSDRDSAHDILHDGFIVAFTRIDTLRDPENIEFWLATIMKNLSLKYLQAQTVTSILEEIPEIVEETEVEDILDFTIFETLIGQLPEGYRNVFRLAVLEGKTHKEISEILGIAPNSSSSQLFHAKLRMRELIRDYKLRAGLLSLILLIACSGLLFLSRKADNLNTHEYITADATPKKHISKSERPTDPASLDLTEKTSESTVAIYSKTTGKGHSATAAKIIATSNAVDNKTPASTTEDESLSRIESDSAGEPMSSRKLERRPVSPIEHNHTNSSDRLFADVPRKRSSSRGWTAGISFNTGITSFNSMTDGDFANQPSLGDPDFNNPDQPQNPENKEPGTQARVPRLADDVESSLGSAPHRHHLPISFALTAEKHLTSWLGLESGIGYSYLHSDFERYKEPTTCHWHYIEIPLKVNLYAYTSPRIKLYGSIGGRVAIPVHSYAQIAPNPDVHSGSVRSKTVWSAAVNAGTAFSLSKHVDIFIEPTLRYNFPQECTIPNIWTDDEPWSISIPIGFRFNW